ncbi:uncharacterized protein FTOL_13025 [Fusarium torulosum]|uniref:SnoaL-like domain-containing protein n=1 Tax=Fusarium torulosum TaxID=33205 RepID=A0AAE8MN26_9HYPO|nr:uncharacterized protein FTOL_13025 [Fusarium torulosum]
MTTSTPLRLGTKSIRSKADLEEYVRHFNRDDKVEYTAYYAKDAVFRFSGFPDRTVEEFMVWADQIHAGMRETLNIDKVVFSPDLVVTELHTQFRGINGYETDNLAGRWGPVWEGNGPLVKMFVWYHLDKDGHVCLLSEDAYVMKEATRDVIRSRDDMNQYVDAFNANNFDVFPRYYTPDIIISLDSKQVLQGKDEAVSFFRNTRDNIREEVDIQSITLDENAVAVKSNIKFTAIANIEDILQFGSGVRKGGGYEAEFLTYYELNPQGKIFKITAAHCGPVKIFNPWKQS